MLAPILLVTFSGKRSGMNYDKGAIHLPRQYFPKLKKACKMGVSDAKEVKFTTGLPLLQEEKIK